MKKNLYRQFIISRGEKFITLKRVHEVRWAPGQLKSATSLTRQYQPLVIHLGNIEVDKPGTYTKKAIENAGNLRRELLDENFLILLHIQGRIFSNNTLELKKFLLS